MLEELKKMNEELSDLKAKHLERAKAVFGDVTKKLFDTHTKLESFKWQQYTPYFNDGEECVFSANTDYISINGNESDMNYTDKTVTDYSGNKSPYPQKENEFYNPELSAAENDVKDFLNTVGDDSLRQMFGDHVEITVTRDGVDVYTYEHE